MQVKQKPRYQNINENDYVAMSGEDWPAYKDFASGINLEPFVAKEIDQMLGSHQQQLDNITNFCVLPFYGREYPADVHCCQLPTGYDIESIQQDLLKNKRNNQCSACWRLEDAGRMSDRQIKNSTLDYYTNTDLLELYRIAETGKSVITHYKIDAGNFCNATCVTCNKGSSSGWGKLENAYNNTNIPEVNLVKEYHDSIDIDYKTAKFIGFTGGEPTMIRTNWDILRKLISAGNTECCISFVTNGSFVPTTKQQHILDQFSNLNFCFSMDGTGKVFEYMRYPLSWDQTVDNIKIAQDKGIMVSASYTISNLNILYHEQTAQWFNDHSIPFLENPVYSPDYFSARALREDIKQTILSCTDSATIRMHLDNHSFQDELLFKRALKNIVLQDKMKKCNIQDFLPELTSLF